MRLRTDLARKICSSFMLVGVLMMTPLFANGAAQAANCTFSPCILNANVAFTVVRSMLTASVSRTTFNGGRAITFPGHDQTIGFSFVTSVIDGRGNGAGWRLTASSPGLNIMVFRPGGMARVNEPLKLSTAVARPVVVTCQRGATCSPISGLASPPLVGSLATPLILESAPVGQGLGAFDIITNGQIFLPANTLASSNYTTTITVVVSNTP